MSKLQNASNIAEVVSAIVVAVTVVIAVLAYLREIETQRAEFTFQTANHYQSEHVDRARNDLFSVIVAEQARFYPVQLSAADLGLYLAKRPQGDLMGDTRLVGALITIAGFFNSASDCVASDLCDGELMRRLLGAEATALHCVFGRVLGRLAEVSNVSDIAYGLRALRTGDCA